MGFLSVVVRTTLVTGALMLVATAAVVGPEGLRRARRHFRSRLWTVFPHLLGLVLVLGVNQVARTIGPEISWFIGYNITTLIYAVEGRAVVWLQSMSSPIFTAYFSWMYLYGYTFLVAFPFVAYFAAEDSRPLKLTAVAYAVNYGFGVVAYILFIAYGPRNFMPDTVEPLLYSTYPQVQLLTRQVNVNTNAFPSLHTSLSTSVALLAWRTRNVYPRWAVIAVAFGVSIIVSTMYLGIHWAVDVVAGVALAVASVRLAEAWLSRPDESVEHVTGTTAD